MANFDFPSSPSNGQSYSANGITYTYNGTVWKRETGATKGIKGEPSTVAGDKGQKGEIGATGGAGSSVPSGGIILWSGATNAIPSGWVLCDGNNGTPDLRDRFVVGAGSGYGVGATGGSADAVVVQHRHLPQTLNNMTSTEAGGNTLAVNDRQAGNYGSGSGLGLGPLGNRHFMQNEGVSGTNKNLPPYYALAYIMKT